MTLSDQDQKTTNGSLLELHDVSVKDIWNVRRLSRLDLMVPPGSAVHVAADNPSELNLFMRLLATLEWPHRGRVVYRGEGLSYAWYEGLLPVKRSIGYLYPTAAMVRNRTIEENLDYQLHYFNDIDPKEHARRKVELVKAFDIEDVLDRSPEVAGSLAQRHAIAVREFLKEPTLFLAEYPEEFVVRGRLSSFIGEVRRILSRGGAFIFGSNYRGLGRELDPVELVLKGGKIL